MSGQANRKMAEWQRDISEWSPLIAGCIAGAPPPDPPTQLGPRLCRGAGAALQTHLALSMPKED